MRSLLVGIAIVIAGATATRSQTLPFYNIDELAKNWNLLASSIRLQCIANRSVDSYFGLKQCIEHVAKRGREIALRKQ